MIRAVSFDLWDTLVHDDSDEAERARRGLLPKPEARRKAFIDEVLAHHPSRDLIQVESAFDRMNERFRHQWKVEHRTPHIADRLRDGFRLLDLAPTPGFDGLVDTFARMEVEIPPNIAPGAHEMLSALADRMPLAIISDAIVTPGTGLREILAHHDLLRFFRVFIFSDEVGASKPSPVVFRAACEGLGVSPAELAHVGDRESNDIAGPQAFGARGVLYTGCVDRGSADTRADAVVRHHRDLADAVAAF